MKVITVSVSKHSSGDRSYAHDAWELLGQNDHHWFVKCLTKSFSWSNYPVIMLEKQYYDIFDVPKNISEIVVADYRKRNPNQDSDGQKSQSSTMYFINCKEYLPREAYERVKKQIDEVWPDSLPRPILLEQCEIKKV